MVVQGSVGNYPYLTTEILVFSSCSGFQLKNKNDGIHTISVTQNALNSCCEREVNVKVKSKVSYNPALANKNNPLKILSSFRRLGCY